jgi:hypothetical protein
MEEWFNAPQKLFGGRRQYLPRYVRQTVVHSALPPSKPNRHQPAQLVAAINRPEVAKPGF